MAFFNFVNCVKTTLFSECLRNPARYDFVRWASKKTSGHSKNRPKHPKPKRRKILCNDGHHVQAGQILIKQLNLRFHPGLNVGFGANGTLFAMEEGRVVVTCEKIDPNWSHTWIERIYGGRMGQIIHKKYFNVIPNEQVGRFRLVDEY